MDRLNKTVFCAGIIVTLVIGGCDRKEDASVIQAEEVSQSQAAEEAVADDLALAQQVTGRFIVKPGIGMGGLLFGMDQTEIETHLGPPNFKEGDSIFQYTGLAIIGKDGNVYIITCGDATSTTSRHATDCPCQTTEGIQIGSTKQDVLNAYGEPDKQRDANTVPGAKHILYRDKAMIIGLVDDKVYMMNFQKQRE